MVDAKSGATRLEGNGKRILIIYGAPRTEGLCHDLGEAYAQGARSQNHIVRSLKPGVLGFDPILHGGYEQSQPLEPDLLDAQRQIHWAEHLVLVYPVLWGGIPTLLSGFFDRVLTPGFAFKSYERKQPANALLEGRSAELLVTLDSRPHTFHWLYGAPAHRQMTRSILDFCGITHTRLTEFSPVRNASEEQRQAWVRQAETLGRH